MNISMTSPATELDPAQTRLLKAATDAFVEHGLKAATVRKICEHAHVNVAMVSYYYRSKEDLYLAVLKAAVEEDAIELRSQPEHATAEDRLGFAIARLTRKLLTPGSSSPIYKLIAWELLEPSAAIGALVETQIKPQHDYFANLVNQITDNRLDAEQVRGCVLSIIGQAVFYSHSRQVHELATPTVTYDDAGIDRIAAHIALFSLAALHHLKSTTSAKSL